MCVHFAFRWRGCRHGGNSGVASFDRYAWSAAATCAWQWEVVHSGAAELTGSDIVPSQLGLHLDGASDHVRAVRRHEPPSGVADMGVVGRVNE